MCLDLIALGALAAALLAQRAEDPVAATWERFPAFVWRQNWRDRPVPAALVRVFGGVNVEGDWEDAEVRAAGLDFYVGNGPGRDELHLERDSRGYAAMWQRWFEERDDALLVREPCLTDPRTRAALFERLAVVLAARSGDHGVGVALGDEVSLTPWGDPLDLCHSETCLAAWEQFTRARFGAPLPYPSTDDVRRRVAEGDASALGAWLARREFHQGVMLDLLGELAARARAHPSAPRVGLLGMAGRTAFGGVAIERIAPLLDFAEAYPQLDGRELLLTARADGLAALATVFPDPAGPDGSAWQVWSHFARGGDGLVLWSDRELERAPELAARLEAAVSAVRAVRAELTARGLRHRPRPQGIALVHDWRSVAVGWLRDALLDGPTWPRRFQGYQVDHGTWELATDAWLRLAEDAGAMPGALPLERVGAHTLERFPLLVLNHNWVLDDADLERLEGFVAAGGRLWVDGELGWIDAQGRLRAEDAFERLAARAPERVARAPARIADYARLRARPASGRAASLRAELARQCDLAEVELAPAALAPDPPMPISAHWTRAGADRIVLVALPNWNARADRAEHLAEARIALVPDEGWEATWLYPPREPGQDSVRLPRGDALVVVLERGPPR